MEANELKSKTVEEVYSFIRQRLGTRRFEMSGYDSGKNETCTVFNISLLNEFADLGIYNYTAYLFVDFYKGSGTIYLKYFQDLEDKNYEVDVAGWKTVEIMYHIFELTIFSDRTKRRRY